jgi:predicted enzyme related to lactoylglutathione lyase
VLGRHEPAGSAAQAAADFYGQLFGWEIKDVMPPDSPGTYLIGQIRGGDVAAVSSIPDGAPPIATWNTYIDVADTDATAARVKDSGGAVLMDPFDVMAAGRMAVFADPEGAVFMVWQAKEQIGAQVVNEHGALNFNTLHTRDADAAKAFYNAVFGWTVLALPSGDMWTLPGYGDHLELSTPGLREMVAQSGAPADFVDVVAPVLPIGDDLPDLPAHWSVTFGVDDADAIAARATELGGTVVVPPTDAPWVRMTVISDPAGANSSPRSSSPRTRTSVHPRAPRPARSRGTDHSRRRQRASNVMSPLPGRKSDARHSRLRAGHARNLIEPAIGAGGDPHTRALHGRSRSRSRSRIGVRIPRRYSRNACKSRAVRRSRSRSSRDVVPKPGWCLGRKARRRSRMAARSHKPGRSGHARRRSA